MTHPDKLVHLTRREAKALRVLIDKREVYRATGHGLAARTLSMAIWLVWQVFEHVDVDVAARAIADTQPADLRE